MTFIVIALVLIAAALAWRFWTATYTDYGYTKSERAFAAREYARWLNKVYPALDTEYAARERQRQLKARAFKPNSKDEHEIVLCRFVLEGWHKWTGATV